MKPDEFLASSYSGLFLVSSPVSKTFMLDEAFVIDRKYYPITRDDYY